MHQDRRATTTVHQTIGPRIVDFTCLYDDLVWFSLNIFDFIGSSESNVSSASPLPTFETFIKPASIFSLPGSVLRVCRHLLRLGIDGTDKDAQSTQNIPFSTENSSSNARLSSTSTVSSTFSGAKIDSKYYLPVNPGALQLADYSRPNQIMA
ncbi:unnamed protein product, partial [Protopolystoma xenopodis]